MPANPARTFHEALQSLWFTHLVVNLEAAADTEAPGRMDQYLYPLYEKDIREGTITRQEAAELLSCLWVKLNEMEGVKGLTHQQYDQGSQFQDVTICGVTKDGKDATNELSYLMLEVTGQMKMPQPPLYIRYHNGISEDLMVKALQTNRKHGAGNPCFLNDAVTLLKFVDRGVPLTDARDYSATGCIAVRVPNATPGDGTIMFNKVKAFELALNNGIDTRTGKQLGPATGDPRNFKTYEELYDAFIKQLEHAVHLFYKIYQVFMGRRGELYSNPFISMLQDDCIKTGKNEQQLGGARYPQLHADYADVGHQNVADSLTAIKKLVFEEKKISMTELLDALAVNFEGKEELRQMLLTAPKYGNDDDYADNTFNEVTSDTMRIMAKPLDWAGYPLYILRGGGSGHYYGGITVGALPDGRKAYVAVADGNLSPVQGMDIKGPTAVILSATKINHTEYAMTTLLNMKIMPAVVQTKEGIRKVISLVKTFFDRGGWHVQFNMIDQETLLEAQKHPEQYRNLMVRVGGYSAYFVELSPEVQNDIISRTQHILS